MAKTVLVWARLSAAERERLERMAQAEDRSLSYIISRFLREKLAEQRADQVPTR
jgi:predicted transcriptional regulator